MRAAVDFSYIHWQYVICRSEDELDYHAAHHNRHANYRLLARAQLSKP